MDVQQQTETSTSSSATAASTADTLQDPLASSGLSDPLSSSSSTPSTPSPSPSGAPESPNLFNLGPVQADVGTPSGDVQSLAQQGISGNGGSLPHQETIQQSFGTHDISGITAHTDGKAQEAVSSMGANGYATGSSVALKNDDLHTAAHEAAHVVQQKSGVSLSGGVGAAGDSYERHADAVADAVVAGQSAQTLLDNGPAGGGAGGVQLDTDPTAAVNNIATTMDAVDSMEALQNKLGFLLDALAPTSDMSRKIEVGISLKLNPALSIGFKFDTELSRADGKLKMKTGLGFEAKAEADAWIAKAFAKVNLGGFLEIMASNGRECMSLLGVAIYNAIAAVSTDLADLCYGNTFIEDVRKKMDNEDYVEAGLTGSASAGASWGSDDSNSGEVEVGAKTAGSTRFGRNGVTENRETMAFFTGSVKVPGSKFAGKLEVEGGRRNGQPKGKVQLQANGTNNAAKFMEDVANGKIDGLLTKWVSGTAASIRGLIVDKVNPTLSGGRTLGQMLGTVANTSLSANIGSAALAERVSNKLEGSGAELAQRLDIKLEWEGNSTKLDVSLDRVSTMKLDRDLKAAKLEVMVETVTRMINIPTIEF